MGRVLGFWTGIKGHTTLSWQTLAQHLSCLTEKHRSMLLCLDERISKRLCEYTVLSALVALSIMAGIWPAAETPTSRVYFLKKKMSARNIDVCIWRRAFFSYDLRPLKILECASRCKNDPAVWRPLICLPTTALHRGYDPSSWNRQKY